MTIVTKVQALKAFATLNPNDFNCQQMVRGDDFAAYMRAAVVLLSDPYYMRIVQIALGQKHLPQNTDYVHSPQTLLATHFGVSATTIDHYTGRASARPGGAFRFSSSTNLPQNRARATVIHCVHRMLTPALRKAF